MDQALAGLQELQGVVPKWIADYWDGPISGVAEYEGSLHWFHVRDYAIEDEPTPAECLLYELSDPERALEGRRHDLFRKFVGTHTDLDAAGRRGGVVQPRARWPNFFDSDIGREGPDYRDHPVLGWFRLARGVGHRVHSDSGLGGAADAE